MISSKHNQYVKLIKELRTKKGRERHKKLVIEGKKTIIDCLNNAIKFDYILYDESCKDFVANLNIPKFETSKEIIEFLSNQITTQGIIAVVEQPILFVDKPETNFLVLDGLQDAGNVGTILRTALATNFRRVILIDCVDVFSDKVVSASMTAVFNLELQKCKREEFITKSKEWKLPVWIADLDGENALSLKQYYDIIGLVIGNEGNGVSDVIKKCANKVITLPMDKKIESLNAGVSASVLMYIIKYKLKGE